MLHNNVYVPIKLLNRTGVFITSADKREVYETSHIFSYYKVICIQNICVLNIMRIKLVYSRSLYKFCTQQRSFQNIYQENPNGYSLKRNKTAEYLYITYFENKAVIRI